MVSYIVPQNECIEEFTKLLNALSLTKECQQKALTALADTNNDGNVDIDEFKTWVRSHGELLLSTSDKKRQLLEGVLPIFDNFDENGDKKISWEEFVKYMTAEGHDNDQIKQFWTDMDLNKDGFITFDEFWENTKGFNDNDNDNKDDDL